MDFRKLSSLLVAALVAGNLHPGSDLLQEDSSSFILQEDGTSTLQQEG